MLPSQDQTAAVILSLLATVTPDGLTRQELRSKLITWFGITPDELALTKLNRTELFVSSRMGFPLSAFEISGYAHHTKQTDQWSLTQIGWLYWISNPTVTRQSIAENSELYVQSAHHRYVIAGEDPKDTLTSISHLQRLNAFRTELSNRENGKYNPYWDTRFQSVYKLPVKRAPEDAKEVQIQARVNVKMEKVLNLRSVPADPALLKAAEKILLEDDDSAYEDIEGHKEGHVVKVNRHTGSWSHEHNGKPVKAGNKAHELKAHLSA